MNNIPTHIHYGKVNNEWQDVWLFSGGANVWLEHKSDDTKAVRGWGSCTFCSVPASTLRYQWNYAGATILAFVLRIEIQYCLLIMMELLNEFICPNND